MQEINKCCRHSCVKAILANKSAFFISRYNRDSIKLGPIDSDDENEDQSIRVDARESLLAQIGKYAIAEQSQCYDDSDGEVE